MDLTEQNCLCSCGQDLQEQKYVICVSCIQQLAKKRRTNTQDYIRRAKQFGEEMKMLKNQAAEVEDGQQLEKLQEEEEVLKKELSRVRKQLDEISEQNANIMTNIFKREVELLQKFNEKDREVSESASNLQKNLFVNMKLNEEKQLLRNVSTLQNMMRLDFKLKQKRWYFNGIQLNENNTHLILPLVVYILDLQTSNGKAARKLITYIDIQELILVVKQETDTKNGIKIHEKQVSIGHVKPQTWLSYLEKQLNHFIKHHKIEIELFSAKKITSAAEDSLADQVFCLLKAILRYIDDC